MRLYIFEDIVAKRIIRMAHSLIACVFAVGDTTYIQSKTVSMYVAYTCPCAPIVKSITKSIP